VQTEIGPVADALPTARRTASHAFLRKMNLPD
jgi:hypothetical protein